MPYNSESLKSAVNGRVVFNADYKPYTFTFTSTTNLICHLYCFIYLTGVEPEPFELGEHLVEASGKLLLIDQLLQYLLPRQHKVLLFSQMTRMLDIIQDYLGYRGRREVVP